LHHAALIGLGVVLFAITIVVNMFARSVASRTSRMLGTT
jgi:ABC-type phosphate transport system permease subunit